jgi:hypothetical protein
MRLMRAAVMALAVLAFTANIAAAADDLATPDVPYDPGLPAID